MKQHEIKGNIPVSLDSRSSSESQLGWNASLPTPRTWDTETALTHVRRAANHARVAFAGKMGNPKRTLKQRTPRGD